jgi:two-component sensor histidine kinase
VWLGTDQGLYFFNPDKHHFFFPLPLKDSEQMGVTGFLETNDGEIWVSTLSSGIRVYNQQFQHLRTYLPENNNNNRDNSIFGMVQDRDGIVWAGTEDGLLRIEPGRNRVRTIPMAGESLLKGFIDKAGTIWWGTASGKVFSWHTGNSQFHKLPLPDESKGWGHIQTILDDEQNTLWLATERAGVYQVDKTTGCISKSFIQRNSPEALLSNQIGTMIWYNDSTLLVSTQEGLHFIDINENKVQVLTTPNGLPANAILNVIKDRNGSLLLTTQYSLCHWDAHTGKLLQYGSREGLLNQSYPFSTAYRLQDKRIVIGMMQNFFYFHPDSLHYTKPLPEVQITGIKVFNQALRIDSALGQNRVLKLSHRQNFFTVEFASMMYYDEPRIQYYYQLEGVDKSWVEAGNKRFASYTNLAGGKYLFKVKAQADNGPATIKATTFSVWVSQPFWRSYWFICVLVLAILGVFYGLYRLRINRLLGLEQVRSRIARDLHDDMGSTLSTISILSSIARQQAKSDGVKAGEYLEKISTYSQRMMEAMDDIVWSVNPVNDSVENLIARMREFGTEMLEPKMVGFTLQTDHLHPSLHLPTQIRYDCFMVFKEAINNAAKYAQCRQVQVTLSSRSKGLQVTIQDDGLGFERAYIQQGNGLVNMQKRIEQLKGSLQIESSLGKGTCITFFIPNL